MKLNWPKALRGEFLLEPVPAQKRHKTPQKRQKMQFLQIEYQMIKSLKIFGLSPSLSAIPI
jgi:hypothetical protein